jgi:hypothetical protein
MTSPVRTGTNAISCSITVPPCPVTFDLARRVKLIQVYFKAKMRKKIYPVLLARRTTAIMTLRLLYLKKTMAMA